MNKSLLLVLLFAVPAIAQRKIPPQQLEKEASVRQIASFADVFAVNGLRDGERVQFGDAKGLFVYDAADVTPENATSSGPGTTMDGPGGVGLIKRVYEGPVDVAWWGAAGDGLINDTAAIQAAISYCMAAGEKLHLTGGKTYLISVTGTAFDLPTGALVIEGNGATIRGSVGNVTTLFEMQGGNSLTLKNVKFDRVQHVIVPEASTDTYGRIEFDHCTINDFTDLVYYIPTGGAGDWSLDHLVLTGNTATNGRRFSCAAHNMKTATVTKNIVDGMSGTGARGLEVGKTVGNVGNAKSVVITDNQISNITGTSADTFGIDVSALTALIKGNTVESVTSSSATDVEGIYTKCEHVTITNNQLTDAGYEEGMITVKTGGNNAGAKVVSHNTIICTDAYRTRIVRGIGIRSGGVLVTKNRIKGCVRGIESIPGTDEVYDNVQIVANTITDGIAWELDGDCYQIYCLGEFNNLQIRDNFIGNLGDDTVSRFCYAIAIQANETAGVPDGVDFDGLQITGNTIRGIESNIAGRDRGVNITASEDMTNVVIERNAIDNAYHGFYVNGTATASNTWKIGPNKFSSVTNLGGWNFANDDLRSVIDVSEFGAVGDGATNDTAAIQAAIDAVADSGTPVVGNPQKTYAITSQLNWDSATGATLRLRDLNLQPSGAITALDVDSSDAAVVTTLAADTRPGRTDITVTSAVGLEVGDIIRIESDQTWPYDAAANKGEISTIVAISGTTVTLSNPIHFPYDLPAETATITAKKPVSVDFENVSIDFVTVPSVAGTNATSLNYLVNSSIKNCRVNAADNTGFGINFSYQTVVDGCFTTNCGTAGTALGYGVLFQRSTLCHVKNLTSTNCRKGVDFSGSYPTNSCSVRDSNIVGRRDTGMCLDTHGAANMITFEGNTLTSGTNGVGGRGQNLFVLNNTFTNHSNAAIALSGPTNVVIRGNVHRPGDIDYLFPYDSGDTHFITFDNNGWSMATLWRDQQSMLVVEGNRAQPKANFINFSSNITEAHRVKVSNNNVTFNYLNASQEQRFVNCGVACAFTDSELIDNKVEVQVSQNPTKYALLENATGIKVQNSAGPVSLLDFGAVPGVDDAVSRAANDAALIAARSVSRDIYFPHTQEDDALSGTVYYFGDPYVMDDYTNWTGEGLRTTRLHWSQLEGAAITGATQANPVVLTVGASHGFQDGDTIVVYGVAGMTQLNANEYTVANAGATTIELSGVDGTGYGAYTSGGYAGHSAVTVGKECSLNGIDIRGKSDLGSVGLHFDTNANRNIINNCRITNAGVGVLLNKAYINTFQDCYIGGNSVDGVRFVGGTGVFATKFLGGEIFSNATGVCIDGRCNDIELDTTIEANTSNGLHITSTVEGKHGIRVRGYFEENGSNHIWCEGANTQNLDIEASFLGNGAATTIPINLDYGYNTRISRGCTFDSTSAANEIQITANCRRTKIEHNTLSDGLTALSIDDQGRYTRYDSIGGAYDRGTLSGAQTFDFSQCRNMSVTLSGDITPTFSGQFGAGMYTWQVTQNGTGGHSITWPASVTGEFDPDATANAVTTYRMYWDGSDFYVVNGSGGTGTPGGSTTSVQYNDGGGNFGGMAGWGWDDVGHELLIAQQTAASTSLTLRNHASQTGNPFEIQSSGAAVQFSIDPDGDITTVGEVLASGVVGASSTEAIQIPSGTTAQRPGTPVDGDLRVNTTDGTTEIYRNSDWRDLETGSTPEYGEISRPDGTAAAAQDISSRVELTGFTNNGISTSNITPDQSNDRIDLSVDAAGDYRITFSMSALVDSSESVTFDIAIDDSAFNGNRAFTAYMLDSTTAPAGTHVCHSQILTLSASDEISIYADAASAIDIQPKSMYLNIEKID